MASVDNGSHFYLIRLLSRFLIKRYRLVALSLAITAKISDKVAVIR